MGIGDGGTGQLASVFHATPYAVNSLMSICQSSLTSAGWARPTRARRYDCGDVTHRVGQRTGRDGIAVKAQEITIPPALGVAVKVTLPP